MSRSAARGRKDKNGNWKRKPEVDIHERDVWLKERGVTVLGSDLDEAPQAYRRLPEVLAAHAGSIAIQHTLSPFGVIMAGPNVFDPYKD